MNFSDEKSEISQGFPQFWNNSENFEIENLKSLLEETNFWIFNFSKQSTGCTDQNVIKCIQEISRIISKIIIIKIFTPYFFMNFDKNTP